MNEELKPCCYCNKNDVEWRYHRYNGETTQVAICCKNCRFDPTTKKMGFVCRGTEEEAVAAWNKRHSER